MIDSNFFISIFLFKFVENKNHLCLVPSEFGKVTVVLGGLDNVEYGTTWCGWAWAGSWRNWVPATTLCCSRRLWNKYANWIVDHIDPNRFISHRLYRRHTVFDDSTYIKLLIMIWQLFFFYFIFIINFVCHINSVIQFL